MKVMVLKLIVGMLGLIENEVILLLLLLLNGVGEESGGVGTDFGPIAVLGDHVRVAGYTHATCGKALSSLLRSLDMFLQVLLEICLLGVGLPAVLTNVGFQMLRLLVLGNVIKQRVLVDETLVAGITFERLISRMTPRV